MKLSEIKDKKVREQAKAILDMFKDFDMEMDLAEVVDGLRVTHIRMRPKKRVRMKSLELFYEDLHYALGMKNGGIRIEAPVLGKTMIGVNLLKEEADNYLWTRAIKSKKLKNSKQTLPVILGMDDLTNEFSVDITKLPHLLMAGTTGSGKSVGMHGIINSLISSKTPDEIRFFLMDPKRIELAHYKGLPHLLAPVITDAKTAVLALNWASEEMLRRYDVLQEHHVRDIDSYHMNILTPARKELNRGRRKGGDSPEAMPFIVIMIDEIADIMLAYPRELEASIVRLAQMSRAVGIHLIFSTQRPSVNVITGLIKANIPSRIALSVASGIDSRTILNQTGAERLGGKGDALFLDWEMARPIRIQMPYISEEEVKANVKKLTKKYGERYDHVSLSSYTLSLDDESEDDLYEDAREAVIKAGKASTSLMQRTLRIGYARASRLIDVLEDRGVIGPADGSKPRKVLTKK